jgi:hypothetical protein
MIYCVRHASGVDGGVVAALTNLPGELVGSDYGVPLLDALAGLPAVVTAIDTARDDPDNLFMTFGSENISDAFWPAAGQYRNLQAGMSAQIQLDFNVDYSQNVSLWDRDFPSGNDHLGSVTIFASDAPLGEIAKLAKNPV